MVSSNTRMHCGLSDANCSQWFLRNWLLLVWAGVVEGAKDEADLKSNVANLQLLLSKTKLNLEIECEVKWAELLD